VEQEEKPKPVEPPISLPTGWGGDAAPVEVPSGWGEQKKEESEQKAEK